MTGERLSPRLLLIKQGPGSRQKSFFYWIPAFAGMTMFWSAIAWSAVIVTDDEARRITLPRTASRIVSVAPGATEMLFAAGAGQYVIAPGEYSDEPLEARLVPRIGDGSA